MNHLTLKPLLKFLFEKEELQQFYGSNFQFKMKDYIKEEDGLAQYGVSYSDIAKWGINPETKYFPVGIYFYYLSPSCDAGLGNGFATDRRWANVAQINNEKMVILKSGHRRNFNETSLKMALRKIETKYGPQTLSNPQQENKFARILDQNLSFAKLGTLLSELADGSSFRFNKLLHEAGYDGIVDYDGLLLPIENCQGVITWPTGAKFIEAIPTPRSHPGEPKRKSPTGSERFVTMGKRIKYQKNGSLQLSSKEISELIKMLPEFFHKWDMSDSRSDFVGLLLQKLDFNHSDSWDWVTNREFGEKFYDDLEQNPTTPLDFWKSLLYSSDLGARLTAQDMVKNSVKK